MAGALRIEDLKATQAALGPFLFNALYQGRPMPLEGNLFRRSSFRYFQDGGGHYVLSRPDAESLIVDKEQYWRFVTADLGLEYRRRLRGRTR